jgi:hypothetical protein
LITVSIEESNLAVTAFACDAERRCVYGADEAKRPIAAKIPIAPVNGRSHRFRRKASAVHLGGERPAGLGNVRKRWIQTTFEVGEADLSDESFRRIFFDDPITESE